VLHRRLLSGTFVWLSLALIPLAAQQPPGRGGRGAESGVERLRAFDPAAVERGRGVFGEKCGSCHRPNARGGQGFSGADLIRSVLVLQDAGGRQIGEYLQSGHPDKTRPPIAVTPAEVSDIATFLHREITYAASGRIISCSTS
jgi:mono/diheme cytochrome c family protein